MTESSNRPRVKDQEEIEDDIRHMMFLDEMDYWGAMSKFEEILHDLGCLEFKDFRLCDADLGREYRITKHGVSFLAWYLDRKLEERCNELKEGQKGG